LGGLFLFVLNPQVARAVPAPDCTYTYSGDKKSINRTGCASGFDNATLKLVDCSLADKCYTYTDSHKCVQSILIRDESKPNDAELTGEVYTNGKCENIDAGTVINFNDTKASTPEELLKSSLKKLIDKQCGSLPGGPVQDACYNDYYDWIEACNIRALDKATDSNGDRNTVYRNTFADCMVNKSGGKIGSVLQVTQALPANVYDQIVEMETGSEDDSKSCESEGGALSWFICPVLKIIDGGVGVLSDQIEKQLHIDEKTYDSPALTQGWRVMRNIALIVLIPMMLFMVIGTALDFGPFDAYTVRKALPRMLLAVMFITLSLPILQFFVNISNVVGYGLGNLITTATGSPESLADMYSAGGGFLFSSLVVGGAVVGVAAGFITLGIVGSLALSAFMALLVAYLVLIIRELLILMLIMVAPLAIIVWIFPGNDALWKIWRTTFIALLMMFPLIVLLITSGKVFAGLIDVSQGSFTAFFLKILAFIAPFFFIPATFRYGLGVFGNIAGFVNDRSRGIYDRQKKYRESARASARQQAKMGNRFAGGNDQNFRGRLNRGISGSLSAPSAILASGNTLKPTNWAAVTRTATQDNAVNDVERQLKDNQTLPSWVFNDELARIAAETNNDKQTRELLAKNGYSGQSLEDAAQRIETSRRSMNADTFKILTTKQAIAGGTAYKGNVIRDADGNVVEGLDAGDAWLAVARAAGNNDAAAQYLVANGRGDALKAGRVDQGGAGFGATIGVVDDFRKQIRENGGRVSQEAIRAASTRIHKDVLDGQGAASLVHSSMKPDAVAQMAPTLRNSVVEVQQDIVDAPRMLPQLQQQLAAVADTPANAEVRGRIQKQITRYENATETRFTQNLASISAVHEALNMSSPNKARIISDEVLSAELPVSRLTPKQRVDLDIAVQASANADTPTDKINLLQAIDASKTNPEYLKIHREYGRGINETLSRIDTERAAQETREAFERSRQEPGARPPGPPQNPYSS